MADKLDEALGLNAEEYRNVPSVEVLSPGHGALPAVPEDDSEFARRNIRDAIESSKEALMVAIDVVTTSGAAKETEALSNLLDKFVQANERLVAVGKSAAATKNGEGPAKVVNNTQNVMVVGTTDDLLKAVRRARGERDEEDYLNR